MARLSVAPVERLRSLLASDTAGVRQSLVALLVAAAAALIAGLILAGMKENLEEFPGLLLLVPAAIALRGNVFGAFGSRLGTAIHTGVFRLSLRPDSVMGQNVLAALVLSVAISTVVAVMASGIAVVFGISPTISLLEFIFVSGVGGVIASLIVLAATIAITAGSVRFGWDLDNVTAPLVTATGDVATLPALLIAAELLHYTNAVRVSSALLILLSIIGVVLSLRTVRSTLRRVVQESIPVLAIAGMVDLIAGVTIEKRLDEFVSFPALLVLLPGYLAVAGALGGILSSRLGTKFHLGLVEPRPIPPKAAHVDIRSVFFLALPVFLALGTFGHFASTAFGHQSPGLLELVGIAMFGGLIATVFVIAVAYFGTMIAVRFGLDPDSYGIPIVTSTLDVVGAFTLILAIVAVGVG
jgi:mgtE-like transporter